MLAFSDLIAVVVAFVPQAALDQEAWPQLLRLQEACERGHLQADPAPCREQCGRARLPRAGWAIGQNSRGDRAFIAAWRERQPVAPDIPPARPIDC